MDSDSSVSGYDVNDQWVKATKNKKKTKQKARLQVDKDKGHKEYEGCCAGDTVECCSPEKLVNVVELSNVCKQGQFKLESDGKPDSEASICKGGPGKPTCGEHVGDSNDGVQCGKCESWFHVACQNIPTPAHEALKKYEMLSWFCGECKKVASNTSGLIMALDKKVERLDKVVKDQLGRMVHCLREQERSVDNQTKLIERSIRENVAQKATYAEMVRGTCSEVVDKVSAKLTSLPQLASAQVASTDSQRISRAFDDFLDKERRKSNLVIHNLPEPDCASSQDRSEQDVRQFQELVKYAFRIHVKVTKAHRVGRIVPGRRRLLIVTLESPELKQDVLQMAPQLRNSPAWGNIYISPDLNKTEREAAMRLRGELKARRSAGEGDLAIRRGRIVSVSGKPAETVTKDRSMACAAGTNGCSASATASSDGNSYRVTDATRPSDKPIQRHA